MVKTADIIVLYVPCGSEDEAANIAAILISEGLIACGNIMVSRSLYNWHNSLVDEKEHILLCKTTQQAVESAQARIEQLHSYDTPCIISVEPASVNAAYAAWVSDQVDSIAPQARSLTKSEVGG